MNKKILVVDGNADAAKLADVFRMRYTSSNVKVFKNLCDLEYYIEDEDNRQNIGVLILDMTMNSRELDEDLRAEARQIGFSGWIFYDKVLKKEYKDLYDKTILYTSFTDEFTNMLFKYKYVRTQEEFNKIPILHKKNEGLIEKAKEMVERLLKSQ